MHPKCRSLEALRDRCVAVSLDSGTQHQQQTISQKGEVAPGTQDPGSLGYPPVRIAPDRRAILADREVEGLVRERCVLRISQVQWELDSVFRLKFSGGCELIRGIVNGHGLCSSPRHPC